MDTPLYNWSQSIKKSFDEKGRLIIKQLKKIFNPPFHFYTLYNWYLSLEHIMMLR